MATTYPVALTDDDRRILRAALDRLIPPVDDLPGAGGMGILDDVERMAAEHARYQIALVLFLAALASAAPAGFLSLAGDEQDAALRAVEASAPIDFANVLEAAYVAYYSRPEVHARIGWKTGPIQPDGFELPPFDESILDTVRHRKPLWRQVRP
jgi:hypothetical protein